MPTNNKAFGIKLSFSNGHVLTGRKGQISSIKKINCFSFSVDWRDVGECMLVIDGEQIHERLPLIEQLSFSTNNQDLSLSGIEFFLP